MRAPPPQWLSVARLLTVPLAMQRITIMQAPDDSMVPFALLQQKDAELKQLYQEKDAKLSEKDAELKQLYQEKGQLYQENRQLLVSRVQLEGIQVRALLVAHRVDLRGILEHVLRVDGLGTREKDVTKLLEIHATLVDRCKAERKIVEDMGRRPITAEALGKKLHNIWRRVCSDLHPQLSPKEWRLNHPSDRIVLKTNGETQSDVLLLYHVLSHFGYPVEMQDLVPTDST